MDCPQCGHDCEEEHLFGWGVDCLMAGDEFKCAKCGASLSVAYDESWDGEEEHCWWWLERA